MHEHIVYHHDGRMLDMSDETLAEKIVRTLRSIDEDAHRIAFMKKGQSGGEHTSLGLCWSALTTIIEGVCESHNATPALPQFAEVKPERRTLDQTDRTPHEVAHVDDDEKAFLANKDGYAHAVDVRGKLLGNLGSPSSNWVVLDADAPRPTHAGELKDGDIIQWSGRHFIKTDAGRLVCLETGEDRVTLTEDFDSRVFRLTQGEVGG